MLGGEGEGYKGDLEIYPDGTGKGQAVTDKGKRLCEQWIKIENSKVEVRNGDKKIGVNSW
jgi:hypothetical protein